MGRKSTFADQDVFRAVSTQIGTGDSFKLQYLVEETGVSIGSLYHRYQSREGLLAAAWLDALRAFHVEFLAALSLSGREAGERAALATPEFARQQRDRAVILCLGRPEALLPPTAPADFLAAVEKENAKAKDALRAFSKRENISMEACLYGVVAFPLAAVKLYLPGRQLPKSADAFVRAAYNAAIGVEGEGG